tara:strand:- start:452 stop:2278 length:1827 start_codon:yes stop_codon:yes gene_type:complete
MASTISTTALDFDTIKAALKTHLAAKSEFADYDFEASGLSNILDVLAYNTHYNALTANFALNESFLSTAQLRGSIVGLSTGLGYIPSSISSAQAIVNISMSAGDVSGRSSTYTIEAGSQFTTDIDETSYTFQNLERLTATDNGSGLYQFKNPNGETDIVLTEGTSKVKQFIVGPAEENTVYVIPDQLMDTSTVDIKVYRNQNSNVFDEYTDALAATTINSSSKVYFLKESPNGYYELAFGDGTTFGAALTTGNLISVEYLRSSGESGNGGETFSSSFSITVAATEKFLSLTTVRASLGGAAKEGIESIRKNAPYQFATQNRMVTSSDYSAVILRDFPNYITDIRSYGGEDAPDPKYGTVYISILFNSDLPAATVANVKNQITSLAERLAVASFDVEFIDPITTYLGVQTFFQYNPSETSESQSKLQQDVDAVVSQYFTDNLGLFESSFRRSNMLTLIDDANTAVLSSRSNIEMIQRIVPTLNASNNFTLTFPQAIAGTDDTDYRVTSSYFTIGGDTCQIRNQLTTSKLQVFNITDTTIEVDNVGSYDATNGTVTISGLEPQTIIGGVDYIKVKVVPANQSAITPTLNNVLQLDTEETFSTGVKTTATN